MKRLLSALLFLSALLPAGAGEPADWVNPFIGTTNFGACHPGAVVPHGMMAVVPFNVMGSEENVYDKDSRWWSTSYEYHNSFFTGFAHGALSGTGCPELGSLLTMPSSGPLEVDYRKYGSHYKDEKAHPGHYCLNLTDHGIFAEATASLRSSVERYTFPAGQANIVLNLGEGLTNESGATVRKVSDTEIEGSKLLGTFCYCSQAVFPVYFVMRVSKVPSSQGTWKKQRPMASEAQWDNTAGTYKLYPGFWREMSGDDIGYWYTFDSVAEGESIEVRMGISYVSIDNARSNLEAETGSFDDVRSRAHEAWNADLGRIRVKGGTDKDRTVFYTALYHALIHPNVLNDVNGEYPLMESQGIGHTDGTRYTVFSLWDTYRNLHQLLTLVYPERQQEMILSMLSMYDEGGWLPKWELYGRETWTMEGDPAIPVIVDSYLKGIRGFDAEKAYEAMKKGATTPGHSNRMRPDIDPYIRKGYVPLGYLSDNISGDNSVSHALEYYVADNALSLMARELGRKDDAELFCRRALGYRHYYSKEYGCLRPLFEDGTFLSPFNPRQGENFEPVPGFHEGSAWNYSFYVPHDVEGLCKLMGGPKKFTQTLCKVFEEGFFDPANEPDIAYPYLFSRIRGEEWRTSHYVNDILDRYFTTSPDGIPGNDDCGTMSTWAIFSMMGFYPDCPGEPYYTLTSPRFESVEIVRPDVTLHIEAVREGKPERYRISHEQLMRDKGLKINILPQ